MPSTSSVCSDLAWSVPLVSNRLVSMLSRLGAVFVIMECSMSSANGSLYVSLTILLGADPSMACLFSCLFVVVLADLSTVASFYEFVACAEFGF